MNIKDYKVSGKDFDITKYDTRCDDYSKKKLKKKLKEDIKEIADLQCKLYAEDRQSLLVVLQGMDGSGKDSAVKNIMSGVNPQGVLVHSFKKPSDIELEHNYLWRHIQKLPERGQITIFNRSQYENVLISKVHPEIVLGERLLGIDSIDDIDKDFWKERYKQINNFESGIVQNNVNILKFFLHISKDEQRDRFLERIDNKEKNWKFSFADLKERECWDDYQKAYETALKNTSTKDAPWYVIPADNKEFAHRLISKIILEKLRDMNPVFPELDKKDTASLDNAKKQLKIK
jgi:PPK2 family polyphosphate:nucleotide phosphotransferase